MLFSLMALMVGILGGIVLVVIFSLLTIAQRADAQKEKLFGVGWEEGRREDSQTMMENIQTNQEPFEEVIIIPRMSRPGLPDLPK